MGIQRIGRVLVLLIIILAAATPLTAATFYILEDYYNLLYIPYGGDIAPFARTRDTSLLQYDVTKHEPYMPHLYADETFGSSSEIEVNLDGQLELDMFYGKDFALGNSSTTGAGTAGIVDGFGYDFISRILFTASVGERLFIEFDYDSERKIEELGGDRNTYSVTYKGKEDQFLKEVNVGNKELAIKDSRYLRIDEGSADSFAVRGNAGWEKLHMEGLFRFNDALSGSKEFTGSRNSIEYAALDVEYVRRQFYIIPDTGIDEGSLLVYKTSSASVDITIDGKNFALLTRGRDYTFDNTRARIYLLNALQSDEELIVYYEKGGVSVGDDTLGQNAIVDESGNRDNFNFNDYADYFTSPGLPENKRALYLQKNSFNSYWELKNGYFLDEYEGETLFDVQVELRATANKGINRNYDDLLNNFELDTSAGVLFFNFEDSVGFYPRPFPGPEPYPVYNPFDPANPVYGGIADPLPENSINTLIISYSYNTDIYFLDFNLIPGSVLVFLNGVLLDQKNYEVDYEFGMLAFEPGLIKTSDQILVTYNYTGFGSGEQGILTAIGFYYDRGPLYAQNLSAYESGLKGRSAPEIGVENSASFTNATSMNVNLGASEVEDEGIYALFDGEFAFSQTNNNVYGSAIIADMERDNFTIDLSMYDDDWTIASKPSFLPPSLSNRGDILYKNYWEKKTIGSDELRTLSWDIPSNQVFSYNNKAGPYNTADRPSGGADVSLVMEYAFTSGSSDPYASIAIPLYGSNFSGYERLNLVLEGVDVAGESVQLYVEILQEYDEDMNNNTKLDGEATINDVGFQITPLEGNPTVIGTDRDGKANGTIESEDLNDNRYLDVGPENGLFVPGESADYVEQFATGDSGWKYVSLDILSLINNNPEIFQNTAALRLSVVTVNPVLTGDATGKVVINRIWFSGSSIVNESEDYLNMSQVSVNEDPQVRDNALSLSYPGVYEELHGDASYRNRNDLVESLLKVNFDPTNVSPLPQLSQGDEASLARRFALPADISFYSDYTMFLYLPQTESVPSNMDFTLSFSSSQGEKLQTVIPGSAISQNDLWYRIDVHLRPPYTVRLNDQEVGNLVRTGDLRIMNRLAEVQFGFYANGGDVTQPVEIWLDEWFVRESEGHFDTALYAEGTFGYRGDVLSVSEFPLIGNPSLLLGFERQEGKFYANNDERSDRLFTGLDMDLLKLLGTEVYLSREDVTTIRNEEDLPGDLNSDDFRTEQSHALELAFENAYIPSLRHSYDRYVTNIKDIKLNPADYELNDETSYDETLLFYQWFDFPFGLSQSYSFTRFWLYNDTYKTTPSQSLDPTRVEDASVDQQDRFELSFDWSSNYVAGYFLRNKQYTGSSVPDATSWGSAYASRLSTLFKPVGQTVEDGNLSSTTDGYGVDLSIPLLNVVGFNLLYDTDYSQKNFTFDGATRDTIFNHDFEMAVPFFFLGNDRVEVTPLMRRELRGDYNSVSDSVTKRDIYLESYRYMFMPPFYYMHPGGRDNDYKAVNIFKADAGISGSTINNLFNDYILDIAFAYDDLWYVPSIVTISFGGETRREGESYRQNRDWGASIQYDVPLSNAESYFKNNMFVNLEYEGERQFDTKLQNNGISLTAEYNSLRTEFQGLKIYDQIGYTRTKQHIGDPGYSLFPGVPDSDQAIARVVPSDTIANQFKISYLWEVFPQRTLNFMRSESDFKSSIKNEEILTIDSTYTMTDREQAESFSNLPFRLTLEHETEYNIIDNFTFYAFAKFQFGVEEKVAPTSISGNKLTSLGFDLGITIEIIF